MSAQPPFETLSADKVAMRIIKNQDRQVALLAQLVSNVGALDEAVRTAFKLRRRNQASGDDISPDTFMADVIGADGGW